MKQMCNQIKLVEGEFGPGDSADVLLSLIADKIKFHNLQKLLINDADDLRLMRAEHRIGELKEARKSVIESIIKARDDGYSLKIEATVNIEYVKK
ncbi:hypothetical protein [Maribacter sp. 2307UL18-2]|uniref:hypothetical protein n=1 Tax=Maribacter sp. 2307UL18-2 TaxID=3386274 RepID=UPI0039BD6138